MYISGLTLINFRNYEYREFKFIPGTTIITGNNGAGKTNIIESIAYLSALRSHRTNQDNDMVKFESDYAVIMGDFISNRGNESLNILIDKENSKKIKYNNQEVKKLSEVVGRLNTVIFSPDAMEIIKEGPEKRRKFLDVAVSKIDKKYFNALQVYKKVIRQKNKLLKHFEGEDKFMVLDTYNQILAENGSYIEYKRRFFIACINRIVGDILNRLTGGEHDVYIDFESQVETEDKLFEEIKKDYTQMLEEIKFREIERHTSVKGSHLDDLGFYLDRRSARKFCSQGQQRIFLLATLFAQIEIALAETGESPIVLLDDVLSELDNERKNFVLNYISSYQTFITTANNEESFLQMIKNYDILRI